MADTVAGAPLTFGVLGPLEMREGGHLVPVAGERQRQVLALLLLNANRAVGIDELTAAIWDEDPPVTARRQVQNAVSQVRQLLLRHGGGGLLRSLPDAYQLRIEPDQLDLLRFESLTRDGRRHAAAGQVAKAAGMLRGAVSLWRGPALAALPGDRLRRHAVRLDELYLSAVEACVEQELAGGDHDRLAVALPALVDEHPLRERLAGVLMVALYRTGRQAEALAVHRRVAGALRDELGVDPGPELHRIFAGILRRDPALDLPPPTGPAAGPDRAGPPASVGPVGAAPALPPGDAGPPPQPARPDDRASRAPARTRFAGVLAATVGLALLSGSAAAVPPRPEPPMTGLFNVLVVPFAAGGSGPAATAADRFQARLLGPLRHWSSGVPGLGMRVLGGPVGDSSGGAAARAGALERLARRHGADLVVAGRTGAAGPALTISVDLFVTERTLGETPEFVGLHTMSITEPGDILAGNWQLSDRLADGVLHHVEGIVGFTRGLGEYALDDFPAATRWFVAAEAHFAAADKSAASRIAGREVVDLMLGNAIGRTDIRRAGEAERRYQHALTINPSYHRALIGLAESSRAAAQCDGRRADVAPLRRSLTAYRAALAILDRPGHAVDQTLLEMKARLGLGLAYQCLSLAVRPDRWAEAMTELTQVVRLQQATRHTAPATRHGLRLAAEAEAGIALTALLTGRYGGYPAAAAAYRRALALLAAVDVVRPTHLDRQRVYLCNLRYVYHKLADPAAVADVDRLIAETDRRRAAIAAPATSAPVDAARTVPC
jgi:DNA-binding SARP family transcriptional activator/tetratricopeptide (TPR) repeat protein